MAKYNSAQVVITEKDISQVAEIALLDHGYLILGETAIGRDDKALSIATKNDFITELGATNPDYPSVYCAMEYLSYGNKLYFKRVTSTKFIRFATGTRVSFVAPTSSLVNGNLKTYASYTGYLDGSVSGASIYIKDTTGAISQFKVAIKGIDSTKTTTVVAATTAALSGTWTYANGTLGVGATLTNAATGATTIDGVALTIVGQKVLIQDQASDLQNGVYSVTTVGDGTHATVLTRDTGFDTSAELLANGVYVSGGTVNEGLYFVALNTSSITIGTDSITFGEGYIYEIYWNTLGVDFDSTGLDLVTNSPLLADIYVGHAEPAFNSKVWFPKTTATSATASITYDPYWDQFTTGKTLKPEDLYVTTFTAPTKYSTPASDITLDNATTGTHTTMSVGKNFFRIAYYRTSGSDVYLTPASEYVTFTATANTDTFDMTVPQIPSGYNGWVLFRALTPLSTAPDTTKNWEFVAGPFASTKATDINTEIYNIINGPTAMYTALGVAALSNIKSETLPTLKLNNSNALGSAPDGIVLVSNTLDSSTNEVSVVYKYETGLDLVDSDGTTPVFTTAAFSKGNYSAPVVGDALRQALIATIPSGVVSNISIVDSSNPGVVGTIWADSSSIDYILYDGTASSYDITGTTTLYFYKTILGTKFYMYPESAFDLYTVKLKGRGSFGNTYSVYATYDLNSSEYSILVYNDSGTQLESWDDSSLTNLVAKVNSYSNWIELTDITNSSSSSLVSFDTTITGATGNPYYKSILVGGYDGYYTVDESDFIANINSTTAAAKYASDSDFEDLLSSSQQIESYDTNLDYEVMVIPTWSSKPSLAYQMNTTNVARKYSCSVIDLPSGLNYQAATLFRTQSLPNLDSSYTAMYWNYGKVYDSINDINVWLPPSVFAVKALAVTDSSDVPYAGAAGLRRGLVPEIQELEYYPSLAQREALGAVQVNPIAQIANQMVVWGNRTSQKIFSMLSNFNVRRLLISAEKAVYNSSLYALFDPNDKTERTRLITTIQPIFDFIRQKRGLDEFALYDVTTDSDAAKNVARFRIALKPTPVLEVIEHEFTILNPTQSITDTNLF